MNSDECKILITILGDQALPHHCMNFFSYLHYSFFMRFGNNLTII